MKGAVLAIEVSNPSAYRAGDDVQWAPGVALGVRTDDGVRFVGAEPLKPEARHDDDLMPAIDRLMRAHGIEPKSLERIFVSIGPGGFTGLRVAAVTAQALAMANGAEVVPVPTAAVAGGAIEDAGKPALVLLASKRVGREPSAWAEVAGPDGVEAIGMVTADEIPALAREHGLRSLVADGALPDAFEAAASAAGLGRLPLRLSAQVLLEVGAPRATCDPSALAPLYGREPEAVRKWRELRGNG